MVEFVSVDPKNAEHLGVLYSLLFQRQPHQNISHRVMPFFADHVAFVESKPYIAWYLIKEGRGWVGSTYLTPQRELGIFLFEHAQGGGIGKRAVKLMLQLHPGNFYANIAPSNTASQRFFEAMGFRHIQQTYFIQGGEHASKTT